MEATLRDFLNILKFSFRPECGAIPEARMRTPSAAAPPVLLGKILRRVSLELSSPAPS